MSLTDAIPIWQIDAFTERPFAGNPAAVCLLDRFPADRWMQNVAAEMNLSETSFVVPSNQSNDLSLRWFTPATEVDLCGHATLAATHALIESHRVDVSRPIRFQTRSGELVCTRDTTGITLDFPATPASNTVEPKVSDAVRNALKFDGGDVLRTQFDLMVVIDDAEVVRGLEPDFAAMHAIDTRGVIVTAAESSGIAGRRDDFVSRFFAPRCGINEDPVTGSAHCGLAPYWAEKLGRGELIGYQASARGGTVRCRVVDDRVHLTGHAVTMFEGRLHPHAFCGKDS